MFCDLRRGNADAAARRMHENSSTRFQSAHDDYKLPRREVIDRKCCSFQRGHARRPGEDLLHGNANHVRIAAKTGHRQNIASDAACVDTRAHSINAPTDLITGHDRNWRQVRIEAHAAHNIREIDAARFDPNANFARLGLGIGRLPDGENLWRSKFRNPDLPHCLRLRSCLAALRSSPHKKCSVADSQRAHRGAHVLPRKPRLRNNPAAHVMRIEVTHRLDYSARVDIRMIAAAVRGDLRQRQVPYF
jgi:hypothetical protein